MIKLKEEYRGYKIGGGKSKNIHLEDLSTRQMKELYHNGYSEFFEMIVPKKKVKKKEPESEVEPESDIKEDTNTND